jgi:hypothetical protein
LERDREDKKEGIKRKRGSWRKIDRGREEWEKRQEKKLGKDREEKYKKGRESRKEREKDRDAVRKERKKGKLYSWIKTERREELEKKLVGENWTGGEKGQGRKKYTKLYKDTVRKRNT